MINERLPGMEQFSQQLELFDEQGQIFVTAVAARLVEEVMEQQEEEMRLFDDSEY